MADIFHSFIIKAPTEDVYETISSPKGLDIWWSKSAEGIPQPGEVYKLNFGPGYLWEAEVTKFIENRKFELKLIKASEDWLDSKIGFLLTPGKDFTTVDFYHKGWPIKNQHYKISSYCWAMYLRILKRFLEFGEEVPYEKRLEV